MFARTLILISLLIAPTLGCSKDEGKTPPTTAPTKADKPGATPTHAPAEVKPGSHEDWCGEHEVPESQCTRCNADLIPAFKATNDWCPEHGLPESQCKICNPDLVITRPPKGS